MDAGGEGRSVPGRRCVRWPADPWSEAERALREAAIAGWVANHAT